MIRNNILKRSGNKKILLAESEYLTFHMLVGRIKKLCKGLCIRILLYRLHILSLRKQIHIEIGHIMRAPETEIVYGKAVSSRYHHIIRNSLNLFIIRVDYVQMVIFPSFRNLSSETDSKSLIVSRNEP